MCPSDRFSDLVISGTNFGAAASDYGAYRAGFPNSLFDRLSDFEVGISGQCIADLGTGTGALARGFALRGCNVVGIDPDERMILEAKALDAETAAKTVYVQATAEDTTLETSSLDVVTAGQCWHWFDRPTAIREVQRILKRDGKLLIAHFDWLPLAGNVVSATEELIEKHNRKWRFGGGSGLYPHWLPGLSEAGFVDLETFSYDVDVPYTPEAWRGRIRASAGVVALSENGIADFDQELAEVLREQYPSEVLQIPHRVFAIVARVGG